MSGGVGGIRRAQARSDEADGDRGASRRPRHRRGMPCRQADIRRRGSRVRVAHQRLHGASPPLAGGDCENPPRRDAGGETQVRTEGLHRPRQRRLPAGGDIREPDEGREDHTRVRAGLRGNAPHERLSRRSPHDGAARHGRGVSSRRPALDARSASAEAASRVFVHDRPVLESKGDTSGRHARCDAVSRQVVRRA